jgi:Ca2+/Na+ antiporter
MKFIRFYLYIIILPFAYPLAVFATPLFNRENLTEKYQDISIKSQPALQTPEMILSDQLYPESETTYIYNYDRSPSKNINTALFISIVPGFFIHGLGHLYVEKPGTFAILLGIELFSISLLRTDIGSSFFENESLSGKDKTILALGLIGWFGSWIADIFGSAATASEMNESASIRKWQLSPEFREYTGLKFRLQFDLSSR